MGPRGEKEIKGVTGKPGCLRLSTSYGEILKKKHPSPSWKRQNKTHKQTHHIEIVKMRVWKELVRADGEGVTPRVGRVPERGLHRGQCAEDEREGLLRCRPW